MLRSHTATSTQGLEAVNAANRSPDGWGALARFEGLGTLVASAARRAAEPRVCSRPIHAWMRARNVASPTSHP